MFSQIKAVIDPFGRMTPHNAAKALQRSPQTLANWRSQGVGPNFITSGGRIFYRYSDLLEYALPEDTITLPPLDIVWTPVSS